MRISAREYERLPDHLKRLFQHVVDGSDEVLAAFAAYGESKSVSGGGTSQIWGQAHGTQDRNGHDDSGSAARFFMSAKAGAQDRWGSRHPTVKPVDLMKWLVALVTPPDGTVLDCFAGSGTTGVAALATGRNAILIEQDASYCEDIRARLAHHAGDGRHSLAAKGRKASPERSGAEGTPLFASAASPANQSVTAQQLCDTADIGSRGCSDD